MPISPLSLTSAPIHLYFDDELLGTATGCFQKNDGKWLLITAWHNLSGRHRWTTCTLRKDGGIPNKIVLHGYRCRDSKGGGKEILSGFGSWVQPLNDSSGVPLWKIHPDTSLGCDVAVLACDMPSELEDAGVGFMSPLYNDFPNMALDAGSSLFILGFPFGIEPFPTWKRATVASEPNLMNRKPVPFLSVDTATRQGLSGSPVFTYEVSTYKTDQGGSSMGPGPYHRFVGLYTGRRPSSQGDDAQIGIVWSKQLIETIINEGVPDVPGHELSPIAFPTHTYLLAKPSQFGEQN